MIPAKTIRALKILVEKLGDKKINWALIESTNLALQGVDVVPNDIDILTDKEGALKIGKLLKEFVVVAVQYKVSKKLKSYYGVFRINRVDVEVMGDMQSIIPKADLWSETSRLSSKEFLILEGLKIPVISLEQEYLAYSRMGRVEKANLIKKVLDSE